MKRPELIDPDTTAGMAELKRMTAKSDAFTRARGMGKASDADLLKVIAFNLELPKEAPDSDELRQHQGDLDDAKLLRHYASKRVHSLAWQDGAVPPVLRRMAEQGDAHAQELLNRVRRKRGLFEPSAEADYYVLHADEREREAVNYARQGNTDAERLANEVARLSRQLAGVLRGEGDLRPRRQAKAEDPRWIRARKKLEQYEAATAGMQRLSPDERAQAARLAAKHKQSLHNYDRDITRAKASRAKRLQTQS
jgi:hypothetical protein